MAKNNTLSPLKTITAIIVYASLTELRHISPSDIRFLRGLLLLYVLYISHSSNKAFVTASKFPSWLPA